MAADIKQKYGTTNQAITIGLDVTPLADGALRESTAIDNTTNLFVDALVGGKIMTGTSPTADKVITVYAYGTVDDGTLYSGGATGTDAAYTGPEDQLFFLGAIVVDATSDKSYEFGPLSVAEAFFGTLPAKWGIVVRNDTGVALNTTPQIKMPRSASSQQTRRQTAAANSG